MLDDKTMEKAIEALEDKAREVGFKIISSDLGFSIPILIPNDTPVELQLRIMAAVKSYLLGVKSMDRTYEKHRDSWEAQIERWEYGGRVS